MVRTSPTPTAGSSPTSHPGPSSGGPGSTTRTFVVDTSVLLSDPRAILRFAEHDVVLPVVVVTELEAKRHHAELGYFARSALRMLDDLRVRHGRWTSPSRSATRAARCASSSTTPTRPSCPPASGSGTTTPGSCPSRPTSRRRGTT
ncbi:PIN domain-containing protein [Cellulosimicrobium sp. CUA-896]|uniref:PIN domain-containing protein n=1 Tax=Cellulosimicrobium sp. CUA-896 TaxID=1517881 RepID=UPI000A7107B0